MAVEVVVAQPRLVELAQIQLVVMAAQERRIMVLTTQEGAAAEHIMAARQGQVAQAAVVQEQIAQLRLDLEQQILAAAVAVVDGHSHQIPEVLAATAAPAL
jgi:hypothetical protein